MDGAGDGKLPGGDTSHSEVRFVPSQHHADLLSDDSVVPSVQPVSQESSPVSAPTKRRGGVSFATNTEIIGPTMPIEGPRRMSSPNLSPNRNIFDTDPPETGCIGFKNIGNTCYMNSVLQCLLHEPAFFNFFADFENTISNFEGRGFKDTALTPEFRKLFNQYWTSKSKDIAPHDFKSKIDVECSQFAGIYQQDGQEFLACMLDKIHEEFVAATTPVNDISQASEHPNIVRAISNDGSSDSAFLSAGSDTNHQSSPFSDAGAAPSVESSKTRKRQSSGSSQADSPPNPASPINNAFNKVSLSDSPQHRQLGSPSTSQASTSASCSGSASSSTPSQPAKRPRLTSECTIVSDDPKKLWDKYMAENLSPISENFQGQFASEICCKMCNNRSTTYENFMFLIVPVPNPEKKTLAIKYACHTESYFTKLAVEVSKKETSSISLVVDAAKELLEKSNRKVSTLDLFEMNDGQIRKQINKSDRMCMLPSRENSELILMESVDLRNEPEVKETSAEEKIDCNICLSETVVGEMKTCPHSCGVMICASCAEAYAESTDCMKCKEKVGKYEDVGTDKSKVNIPVAPALPAILEEQVSIVSLKFKESESDDPEKLRSVSVPFSVRISKKTNSSKLYNYVTMYMLQFCDQFPEFDIHYSTINGEYCSKCGSCCQGCIVPPDFDIQLKSNDHFKIVTKSEIANVTWENSESYNNLFDKSKRPSLQKCLKDFTAPEELGENCVYCHKCQKKTSATKTMTVQRFPDTLIIYLKRFVFEQATSKKIDTEVLFDRIGLDVSVLETADGEKSGKYNLIGSIQHFGTTNLGHYTAYAKDPFDGKWNYYDDSNVTVKRPAPRDAKDVYILFYRRENAGEAEKPLLDTVISNAPEAIEEAPKVTFDEVPGCQIQTMDSTEELWMQVPDSEPANPPRVSPVGSPIRRVGGSINIRSCSPDHGSVNNCSPGSDREELDLDLDYQVEENTCQSDIPDAPDTDNGNYF